jgi:hypothetical protein
MVAKPVTGKAAMEFQSFHVTELGVVETVLLIKGDGC